MSYANTHKGPDPRAMAAATAIQVGIAALVITGLSSGYVPFVETPKPNPTGQELITMDIARFIVAP